MSIFVKSATWRRTLTQRIPALRPLVLITVFPWFPTQACPVQDILPVDTLLVGTLPSQPSLQIGPDSSVSAGATEASDTFPFFASFSVLNLLRHHVPLHGLSLQPQLGSSIDLRHKLFFLSWGLLPQSPLPFSGFIFAHSYLLRPSSSFIAAMSPSPTILPLMN